MPELEIVEWNDEVISEYGLNLIPKQIESVVAGAEFSYETLSDSLSLGDRSAAGFLVCARRAMVLNQMERHTETMELLVSLSGDSVLCLAKPGDRPAPESMRAVRFPSGHALVMHPGTWHWIPYALQEDPSHCLVVFKGGTGDNDLELVELDDSYRLV